VGYGEGVSPPQKILKLFLAKWCILTHSERLREQRAAYVMNAVLLQLFRL